MTGGPSDLVDSLRLAEERATLERDYEFGSLPRLASLLADRHGQLTASFRFDRSESGRARVTVTVRGAPRLICQRCLDGFDFPVDVHSAVELVPADAAAGDSAEAEMFLSNQGLISLRELAEEELLLAVPFAPACATPATCGKAPVLDDERSAAAPAAQETVRPFAALGDLLKKHDRT